MRVETTTNNRKAMAYALAERLGAECRYMGTPTYAYRVGNLTIERDGAITGEHLDLLAVTGWLLEHGYIAEPIPMVEQHAAENIEEQPAEKITPDLEAAADEPITHTCVFLPLSSFTPTGLKNLIRTLYARQRLICEMTRSRDIVIEPEVITTLQSDALTELPILERVLRESIDHGFIKGIDLEDGRIGLVFPHDENDPTRWQHYAKLLTAIVDKAKATMRVNTVMIEPEDSEMKYFCRGFLLQLVWVARNTRNCATSCLITCMASPPSAPLQRWMRTGRNTPRFAGSSAKTHRPIQELTKHSEARRMPNEDDSGAHGRNQGGTGSGHLYPLPALRRAHDEAGRPAVHQRIEPQL